MNTEVEQPLRGRVALVTGASRGVGRATALQLARAGATVIVHYLAQEQAAAQVARDIEAAGGRAFAMQADLRELRLIQDLFTRVDRLLSQKLDGKALHILVNNAGVAASRGIEDTDERLFDELFDVNVKALFFVTQHALSRMAEGGRIINVSSVASRTHFPAVPAYAMTKSAVNALTRHLAVQLGTRGITVNTVSPGVIDTDMSAWVRTEEGNRAALELQALKRVGQPADVADVIGFLASSRADWITGAYLEASGGMKL